LIIASCPVSSITAIFMRITSSSIPKSYTEMREGSPNRGRNFWLPLEMYGELSTAEIFLNFFSGYNALTFFLTPSIKRGTHIHHPSGDGLGIFWIEPWSHYQYPVMKCWKLPKYCDKLVLCPHSYGYAHAINVVYVFYQFLQAESTC
jgi:hypothetical protein